MRQMVREMGNSVKHRGNNLSSTSRRNELEVSTPGEEMEDRDEREANARIPIFMAKDGAPPSALRAILSA